MMLKQSRSDKNSSQKLNFFQKVYEIVSKIPKGKVMTYGQIALMVQNSKFKISPRIVGFALHANKDLKTPCHRVVDMNGKLASNYAFGGWREQRLRLVAEGVKFKDEVHIDLEKHLWTPRM